MATYIIDSTCHSEEEIKVMFDHYKESEHRCGTGFMFVGYIYDEDAEEEDNISLHLVFIGMDTEGLMFPFIIMLSINEERLNHLTDLLPQYDLNERGRSQPASIMFSSCEKINDRMIFTDMVHSENSSLMFYYDYAVLCSNANKEALFVHMSSQTFIALEMFRTQFIMIDFVNPSDDTWVAQTLKMMDTFSDQYQNTPSFGPVYALKQWTNYGIYKHEEKETYHLAASMEAMHNENLFDLSIVVPVPDEEFAYTMHRLFSDDVEEESERNDIDAVVVIGALSKRFDLSDGMVHSQVYLGCLSGDEIGNAVIKCEPKRGIDREMIIVGFLANFDD